MPMFCSTMTVTVTRTYYASPYYVNTLLFTRYTINKRWFSVLRVARFGNGITVTEANLARQVVRDDLESAYCSQLMV